MVKSLGPGKYHDGGGTGLLLRVDPSGGRFWIQRLTIHGKRREIGLGGFPTVTLSEAREAAAENKRAAYRGGDPLAAKRQTREALTFSTAVDRYLAAKLAEFRSDKHRKQWRATLDTYANPVLGDMQVAAIAVSDVQRVLAPIWASKTETASRLRGRIESVLAWATVQGHRTGDNPARWAGNLKELLPKPSKVAKSGNHPALALADVARWWVDLAKREGIAARALQLVALTGARSGEVRGMVWDELDLDRALWTVPAVRMQKGNREYRVPLTAEAMALLNGLQRVEGSPYVFAAPRGGALSDMSLSAVMRRMHADKAACDIAGGTSEGKAGWRDPRSGRPAVPHGLRSTFRQWAAECGHDRDMSEMQLAHVVAGAVERSYQRADMLERRRAMMAQWAAFLRGEETGADVVPLRSGAGGA
ncbi:tyrosine-type recombinase/integrase [Rhodobaculum claviforme]|uniref:Integrase n=1 Tax=Rhodobaculum claviforme TaxID=1549854 RepID=A0A934WJY3_9RHOB|nr:site-specific integrase [Rhodobaculum claviforme]MBK5927988.1 integrase [Rhodobaculum claviforme]